ncbi:hypothetical protein GETHLI_29080 [Geothrix limicola]|uniref:Uncharacterized protein n=1 Tax=Geothrix limicola TaxID=2927978 RepID=A0ABQ5QJ46_9BACT|nr:hypothetical protein [Geothrix limicola]GLH74406.1 hypothetical protein GETHLI_29080 [Geothrix limicola]
MKIPARMLLVLAATAAPVLQAQAPILTGFSPDTMIVHPDRVYVSTRLLGNHFWPSGPNDPGRRHIYIRLGGGAWTESGISIRDISDRDMGISVLSQPYLASPGTLEIKVAIDGVDSNVLTIQVRKLAPQLDSASPDQILLSPTADESAFKVGLRGRYWVTPIEWVINGKSYGSLYQHPDYGDEVISWPGALRKAGVYMVQLKNALGTSEARVVELVGAPVLTGTTPAAIHPSDLAPKPTTAAAAAPASPASPMRALAPVFELRAAFQGSAPTKVAWRTDLTAWQEVGARGAVKGSEVRLPIPVEALERAAWVEIQLANKVGESQIRVPKAADPVTISHRPGTAISTLQTPPKDDKLIVREVPPMPPPVAQRLATLAPRLQPTARAWVDEQANRQRGLPSPDIESIRLAARTRFARPGAPALPATPAPRATAGKAMSPASAIPFNQLTSVNLNDADIEAVAFIVLAQASKAAQDDLKSIMDGVKKIQQQKADLRGLVDQISGEHPEAQRPDAPCTSPLCGSVAARAKELVGRLRGRVRPVIQPVATYGDLAALQTKLKDALDSESEMGETESLRLQMAMDRLSKLMSILSNLEKKLSDTSQGVIGNLK